MGRSISSTSWFTQNGLAFFCCCLIIAGMMTTHFARSLSSIGMAGLLLTSLWSLRQKNAAGQVFRYPYFVCFLVIYALHLTGLLYPENASPKTFERDLAMKLPLVLIPVAFALLPAISRFRLRLLYYFFLVCVFVGSLYSTGYYLLHFAEVNELYKHSKIMETPTNHVRYSLMVAFAIFVGYRFVRQGFYWQRPWEKYLQVVITVWLFIFLHMLAVRSGLVFFYAVAGLGLAFDFFFRKRYKQTVLLGAALGLSLVVAFFTLPTFYNKFFLTIEDVQSAEHAKSAHDYSIAGRVYSYKVAAEIIKDHPVKGVGIGNMDAEMAARYRTMFPQILERGHILPHNQFIYFAAVFGLAGLLVFLICFYYPAFRFAGRFEPLFFIHYLIISLSFLFETTLETQVGLTYSIIFILLPLWHFKAAEPGEASWKNGSFF
ncbi:MAG TPA: O-antigen ligase family protein [Adhaeribacter sp.]|nr:O-antigen ligase family protein [Adhaeribacter sp.]